MWIIPSRRPHLVERVFSKTAVTEPGIVVINSEMASEYSGVKLPKDWAFHEVSGCEFYRDKINRTFADFPNEKYYGIIGDDSVPETEGWDIFLGEQAGRLNIAFGTQVYIDRGGGGAIGGDLIRALGWICLPVVQHFYSDDAIELIGKEFDCLKFFRGIRLAHHHFSVGRAPYDAVYKHRSNGNDKQAFENWKLNDWPILRGKLAPLYS